MRRYLLSLGSSLGNRKYNLFTARVYIEEEIGDIEAISSIFYSPPWGGVAKNEFYNQSLILRTRLSPPELVYQLQDIEDKMGRVRVTRWEDRIIDIDIILYKNEYGVSVMIDTSYLTIPHPKLKERSFMWAPSCQVAPDWIHPQYGVSLKELFPSQNFGTSEGFLKEDLSNSVLDRSMS